ncbi:MAG: sigma-70 family RNA polymerase sigma factor [Phycisphaerales bacterium]|nr:sigma-70 family RNA polymerase sigma factor [Phycisphaerales bacterium]
MQGAPSEPSDQPASDDSTSDGALARRIAAGPRGATGSEETELYRRFAPRVRLYGVRHLRDAHAADDLAQQVMTITLEKLRAGEVREPERLASFVLGTARLTAQAQGRAARRHRGSSDRLATAAETLVSEPAANLDAERLRGCLQALPMRQRTVIVLTFYDQCTAGQIATQLGSTEGNVRVIRHRALASLHACMNPASCEGAS